MKWFRSSPTYGSNSINVDPDRGIIEGLAVITMGEAKGHGVHIDSDFLDAVVEQGNSLKQGLKVRFGHPSMSSTALGTFLGREKNFRRVGDVVRADLFLSNTAKETPNGPLYDYVLEMAQSEPDMFGTSIVFTPGESKFIKGDTKEYATLDKLHANDVVDDPAANPNGLFSKYNINSFASQATEFFDLHPEFFEMLEKDPEIVNGFIERYNEYQKRKGDTEMSFIKIAKKKVELDTQEVIEEVQEVVEQVEDSEQFETEVENQETQEEVELEAETEVTEDVELENEEQEEKELEAEEVEEVQEFTVQDEFKRNKKEFGTEIAVKALEEGLTYEQVKDEYIKSLKAENEELKSKVKLGVKKQKPVSPSKPAETKRKSFIRIRK